MLACNAALAVSICFLTEPSALTSPSNLSNTALLACSTPLALSISACNAV